MSSLLASGRVRPANALARRAPAAWGFDEVAGRFVEVMGEARTTIAVGLLRDAQRQGETTAWVASPESCFFPPDLAAWGIDFDALAVIRPAEEAEALRSVDELLRSGAFGLVVLDGIAPRALSMAVQVRLASAAQQHEAAFVLLCGRKQERSESGSLASLRLSTFRRRIEPGRFEVGFEATKDKRRGRRWTFTLTCDGAPGLR
ncbi:MAG: recombinase A [Planctomycetota bacterium]